MLARWSAKCDTAADKGTLVHDAIKQYASTGESRVDIPEFQAWRRWWLTTGMVPIALEHMVASVDIGVAGTLDALLYSRKTDKLHVFDWKTNERFRLSSQYREFMLPPFSDVPCCEFQSYSLQVSLYRLMLERSGRHRTLFGPSYDRACGASWIVHIGAERATPYRAVDYRARLLEWLEQEPFWSNLSTNA
jgi:ATP-dependent exoDNAse (exonuclease V) beta subunit